MPEIGMILHLFMSIKSHGKKVSGNGASYVVDGVTKTPIL
jgi:hypothetical protein